MEPCGVYDEDDFLLKNDTHLPPCTSDDDDLDSLWLQDSPFHCIRGSQSPMVNFADVSSATPPQQQKPSSKAGKVRNSEGNAGAISSSQAAAKKRRLGADQVRYLEKTFEVDNKLEPDRKAQLAKELGLQPRQVAIWFQNRRARYKTKLLQKDCDVLKASYDRLKKDYDALHSENEKLKNEIDMLLGKFHKKGSEALKKERRDDDDDVKQSNASSAKSDVLDSDSPRQCGGGIQLDERGDSSHAFEAVAGTISDCEEEDDSLSKGLIFPATCFPKLEVADESSCYDSDCLQPNSCNLGFPVQDHGTWFWQI